MSEGTRTVIHDLPILAVDQDDTVLERGTIVIEDGQLAAVRSAEDGDDQLHADFRIDGRGKLALPGLVNAHTHLELARKSGCQ